MNEVNKRLNGRNERKNEWVSEWIKWMNERMNETLLRRPRQPLYPKKYRVSRPRVFESLNSPVPDLVHLPTTFMMMMMMWLTYEIGLPLQSRAHFAKPHLPKVLRDPHLHLFNMFKWKSSSRFSPVHFLPTTPWSSRETAETEALLWWRKRIIFRISRPIMVFKPEFTGSRFLKHFPTTCMMMWTIGLSLQSRAHCSDLIFQKCSETLSFFNHETHCCLQHVSLSWTWSECVSHERRYQVHFRVGGWEVIWWEVHLDSTQSGAILFTKWVLWVWSVSWMWP